ncbi:MAG: hypothetical protein H7Y17_14630 [Chlorobia bacterium]|nr:hypothetical protein [Fimbriimonadaceae bacterium]
MILHATAEEFAKGINLASNATPMMKQASKVMELTIKRNDAHFTKWRNVDFMLQGYPSTTKASAALRELTNEIGKAQRRAAMPKRHALKISAMK